MKYEIIIGCEIHVQLNTASKAFCSCPNAFGGEPNSRVCPVCLGLPGSLPVPNGAMIEKAVRAGHALGCTIAGVTKFDRKNYMYPDLPKAYQISQYDMPIASGGRVVFRTENGETAVRIRRAHMEEDTGKNIHGKSGARESGVDYNRSGTPLLEIVSEPDLRSPAAAAAYAAEVREIMRSIGVSECNMEEGSLRCDANINLWIYEDGVRHATPIVEVKNMNSFKAIRQALDYEVGRQLSEWEEERLTLEKTGKRTRGWNEELGRTVLQRVKEEEADYRYFPEPDIRPIVLPQSLVDRIIASVGELPESRRRRFREKLGLSEPETENLLSSPAFADYFESLCGLLGDPKKAANWMLSEVKKHLNEKNLVIESLTVKPAGLAELLKLIDSGKISGKIAKDIFGLMAETGKSAAQIVAERGLVQITDPDTLLPFIEAVIHENPASVTDYRQGKEKAVKFLMGQVMKKTSGKANPALAEKMLAEKLSV